MLWLLTVLFVLAGCNKINESRSEGTDVMLPGDFATFYTRFHADSSYQLTHITFPLPGTPAMRDSLTRADDIAFRWERDSWVLHHPFNDPDSLFQREFIIVDDATVIEYILLRAGGYAMERRFARIDGDWYLIYYSAMRPIVGDGIAPRG